MAKANGKSRFSLSGNTGTLNTEIWSGVNPNLVVALLDSLFKAKVGVTFSRTRAGDAVCITLLDGDDRIKAYAGNEEELETLLETIRLQADVA